MSLHWVENKVTNENWQGFRPPCNCHSRNPFFRVKANLCYQILHPLTPLTAVTMLRLIASHHSPLSLTVLRSIFSFTTMLCHQVSIFQLFQGSVLYTMIAQVHIIRAVISLKARKPSCTLISSKRKSWSCSTKNESEVTLLMKIKGCIQCLYYNADKKQTYIKPCTDCFDLS